MPLNCAAVTRLIDLELSGENVTADSVHGATLLFSVRFLRLECANAMHLADNDSDDPLNGMSMPCKGQAEAPSNNPTLRTATTPSMDGIFSKLQYRSLSGHIVR